MNYNFLTVQVINTLPLHNMNRDQSGLPKSQYDGGIQRGRISSQALKRAARVDYLGEGPEKASVRTRDGVGVTLALALDHARSAGVDLDEKKAKADIKKVIDGLARKAKESAESDDATAESKDPSKEADSMLLFARTELQDLAIATVEKQSTGEAPEREDFIRDDRSSSLDVASFGRMFAQASDLSTHAAIAVSHAATTHPYFLTADYFSTVDEAQSGHAGAGHLGMAYYTSGTYHRSFTIDIAQMRRSWSRFGAEGSREDLARLVRALIVSLPSGRVTNTNAHTAPSAILVEAQRSRCVYEFDEPVSSVAGVEETMTGYKAPTIATLAAKRRAAIAFDPSNFATALVSGDSVGDDAASDFGAEHLASIDQVIERIVDLVFAAGGADESRGAA